ncbi:LysR substrate-binding domain-containing protein [Candidatus Protofrankia californiensis]|uniref:LysR substrate-binding domain-containing protein n=1 Tax=Candidatus Protofrankia californiensis TaxID=1839754 RepID=UPI00104177BB|nr:LysR substrate-binding domain-containing protein [Candidatus Protofrankia californiensis]
MPPVLDLTALRSLTAIADCGGFRRAAEALCISQSAVSQHVRRLEKAIGRPLVTPSGRSTRFTPDGELLVAVGRRILTLHDDALEQLGVDAPTGQSTITIGSTEHAADHLLPLVMSALTAEFPDVQVRFRLDRGARINEALDQGSIDVAVLIGEGRTATAHPAGRLPLAWFAATHWTAPPPDRPLPLVAIDDPCTIRSQALRVLAQAGRTASVVGEAGYLAGVLHAVRAGVGVALLADVGAVPQGLQRRDDLPAVDPEPLHVRARRSAHPRLTHLIEEAVRTALNERLHTPSPG